MTVKYCDNCYGNPYTTDIGMQKCPSCGSMLRIKIIQPDELEGREKLPSTSSSSKSEECPQPEEYAEDDIDEPEEDAGYYARKPTKRSRRAVDFMKGRHSYSRFDDYFGEDVLRGTVSMYSNTGPRVNGAIYHRFFYKKISDAIIYHQRLDDVLHRFRIKTVGAKDELGQTNYRYVRVNVHGIPTGEIPIEDNMELEIYGKYNKNGIFMAQKINSVDSGYTTPITFRHSLIIYPFIGVAIFAAICLIGIGGSAEGGFFQNIGQFLKIWFMSAVFVTLGYFILSLIGMGRILRRANRSPKDFPTLGILLVSVAIALLLSNSFGIGTTVVKTLLAVLVPVIPVAIIFAIVFTVVKLFRK